MGYVIPNYRSLVPGGYFSSPAQKGQVNPSIWSNNIGAINGNAQWVQNSPGFVTTVVIGGGNPIAVFETPEQGVALWWNLLKRYRAAGVTTVQGIVNRYGGGQDYSEYVKFVVNRTGFSPSKEVVLSDDALLLKLLRAMGRYEAGVESPLHDDQIIYGFHLARGEAVSDPQSAPQSPQAAPQSFWGKLLASLGVLWVKPTQNAPEAKPTGTDTDGIPVWLKTMRDITGTLEAPGAADNPTILAWRDEIALKYPEMASYCREYTHDSIPWCGLTVAFCMAHNNIRPVFGSDDLHRFLWAQAWMSFGVPCEPKPGAVMVFTRNGGGHVSLYEGEEGDYYIIRGGNQSDSVNVTKMSKSKFTGARWPS